ncbi:MAG: STN domain-containing protein [Planctomycetes bacterium]|nr:STN domain-containing protein [Planctomycetota bacterium]
MPATIRPLFRALWPTLSAALLLVGGITPARADDILDKQRSQNTLRTQELKLKMGVVLAEATVEARKSPAAAVDILRQLRTEVQDARYLSDLDRKTLLRQLDGEIAKYRDKGRLIGPPANDKDDIKAAAKDRQERIREEEERNAELKRHFAQRAQLLREGRYDEISKMGDDIRRKHGNIPAAEGFRRIGEMSSYLRDTKDLRNLRAQRSRELALSLLRSSIPISGDIQFPDPVKWRELTKRRLGLKLTDEEKKIVKILNTRITTTIKDKPLTGVLEYFEKTLGLPLTIDKPALDAAQINYETNVSLDVRDTTVRSALKQMLANVNPPLTFIIRKEQVIITTPEKAAQETVVRTYYIGDLLAVNNFAFDPVFNELQMAQNIVALISQIQSIEPSSWREGGGAGTITFDPIRMALIVKQTAEMQFVLQGALR